MIYESCVEFLRRLFGLKRRFGRPQLKSPSKLAIECYKLKMAKDKAMRRCKTKNCGRLIPCVIFLDIANQYHLLDRKKGIKAISNRMGPDDRSYLVVNQELGLGIGFNSGTKKFYISTTGPKK